MYESMQRLQYLVESLEGFCREHRHLYANGLDVYARIHSGLLRDHSAIAHLECKTRAATNVTLRAQPLRQ